MECLLVCDMNMQMDFTESIRTEGAQWTILKINFFSAFNTSNSENIAIAENYERDIFDADPMVAAFPFIVNEIFNPHFYVVKHPV